MQKLCTEMYSALTVESAIVFCFLLSQEIKTCPRKLQMPLVLFWLVRLQARPASEYPIRLKFVSLGWNSPQSTIQIKHLNIHFTMLIVVLLDMIKI